MTSSYSTDLKLELMVTGENAGTWGDKTNTNLNLLQQAIAGYQAVSIAGGAQTTTLTMSNATISNARNAVVKLTGTITGNQIVTIPDGIEKTYIVENGTSGAFTVEFKTVSGTGPTFSTTDKGIKIVYSDGTNVVDVNANFSASSFPEIKVPQINDSNGNEEIKFTTTASAVNELTVTNAATGNAPEISATGGDTNIDLKITPKGSGKVVLDGIKYPNSDGSNGQVLSTDGSGNLAFTTISSSPTQLVQSIPLAAGNSVTAGQLASINSSGEITALPTVNTFGTQRLNSSTAEYNSISTDGSRVLKVVRGGTTYVPTWTFSGVAISNSTTPTNGTVNVTDTINSGGTVQIVDGVQIIPVSPTKFQVLTYTIGISTPCGAETTTRNNIFTVVVDSSGNCTKGNVVSYNPANLGGQVFPSVRSLSKITPTILVFNFVNASQSDRAIITLSSTSTTTKTTDADAEFWTANGANSVLTTNNILGLGFDNTWRTATWTATPSIGTKTDTVITGNNYASSGAWAKMANIDDAAGEYVLQTFIDGDGVSKYSTYSINQTTGALTQVETGLLSVLNGYGAGSMVFKDKNNFLGGNGTFSFTNGLKNTPTSNSPYTFGTMFYNSSDLFYSFSTSPGGFPQNRGYTVNAYATNGFNYIGVAKTTDSTSPVDIVTDGVATGFTSLTPGTIYYATTPADGTVTTSSASGLLIGKAISATEILLQRSNTQ